MEIQEVLSAAENALASDLDRDQRAEAVERYTAVFEQWYRERSDESEAFTREEPSLLVRLAERHEEVIRRVRELQRGVSAESKQLKRKGEGILAYTDVFPKRISAFRKKREL